MSVYISPHYNQHLKFFLIWMDKKIFHFKLNFMIENEIECVFTFIQH